MAEKRSLFKSIFGNGNNTANNQATNANFQTFKLLNTWQTQFTPFTGNAWDINAVRASVDSFARNAAKVTPRHIRRGGGNISDVKSDYNRILQYKPNQYMTSYAFFYKVATQYMINNNAFIYPVLHGDKIVEFYPINATTIELLEYQGEMYCKLKFGTGSDYICRYSDLIHIRRHFNENDVFGSDNKPILSVLKTADTFNQSMSKFAELVTTIRGILKVQAATKTEDLNRRRDDFIRDNLKMDSNGAGVIVTDSKYDYTNIDSKQSPIPTGQLDYVRREIFDYFGTNDAVIQNKAKPEEWNSYYEGELEPFFIQLTQAFTNCCFTDKERGFGNEIIFESNRLQYASLSDKVQAAKFLTEIGAATLDQVLEIFNMAPIGGVDGSRRVQTLNMVNAEKADEYQLGSKPTKKEDKPTEEPTEEE